MSAAEDDTPLLGPPTDAGRACLVATDPEWLALYCGVVAPASPADPLVTIADLASFHPQPGALAAQPGSWALVGLPANLYAVAATHLVDGALLGRAATVRFTPAVYAWDYGDGTGALRSMPGAAWAELGVAEFSATATSHVYPADGVYAVRLSVLFAPEYRYDGGPWQRVAGFVTAEAGTVELDVVTARTLLTADSCAARPADPGC